MGKNRETLRRVEEDGDPGGMTRRDDDDPGNAFRQRLNPDDFRPDSLDHLGGSGNGGSEDPDAVGESVKETGLFPRPELPDLSGLLTADETVADKVREAAEKIRSWVLSTLTALSQIAQGSRELREIRAPAMAQAKEELDRLFNKEETPAFRRAAWVGLFAYELSRDLNGPDEVKDLLSRLVAEGRLKEDPEGPIRGYKERADELEKTYTFSDEAQFDEPEVREVSAFYRQCRKRAWEVAGKAKADTAQKLMSQSSLSEEEFLEGELGIFTIGIPPEPILNLTTGNIIAWRGGGTLQVKSDGKRIFPEAATGNIQGGVEEARNDGLHILLVSLDWDGPPWVRGLDPDEEEAIRKAKKLQFLWHLLKRGLRAAKEARQLKVVKEEMATLVTLTSSDFFLGNKSGISLVEFHGIWEEPVPDEERINRRPNLFFLVERFPQKVEGEEEDQTFIRLAEIPDHLEKFFDSCLREYSEGDQFLGCPNPLGAVLRAVCGQVTKSVQIKEK